MNSQQEENKNPEEQEDREMKLVSDAANKLIEHFDSVQIIATTYENEETVLTHGGRGNLYARRASVRRWLRSEDARDDDTDADND